MNRASYPAKRPAPANFAEQVSITLLRTAEALARNGETFLKPYDLSGSQYNVLRILRGAGEAGLACREVGDRMISRDPDITRLLDRLESRGLIARAREAKDRRVVKTRITAAGLALLAEIDAPIQEIHRRQLGRMSKAQLMKLMELLEEAGRLIAEAQRSDGVS